tara:strand:- start:8410 stop:9882 length:1473 start_codon:yes stop_codon:yes gene_type:complete
MPFTIANAINDLAKINYENIMSKVIPDLHPFFHDFWQNLETLEAGGGITASDRPHVLMPRELTRNVSPGSRNENQRMPEPDNAGGDNVRFDCYYHYAATEVTSQALEALSKDKHTFASLIKREMNRLTLDMTEFLSWQLFNDGNGAYCWTNSSTSTSGDTHTMREWLWNPATFALQVGRPLLLVDMTDGTYKPDITSVTTRSIKAITDTSVTFNTGNHTGFAGANDRLVGYASIADSTSNVITDLGDLDNTSQKAVRKQMHGLGAYALWQGDLPGDAAASPDRSATTYFDPNANELTIRIAGISNQVNYIDRATDTNYHPKVIFHPDAPGKVRSLNQQDLMELWRYATKTRRIPFSRLVGWTSPNVLEEYFRMLEGRRTFQGFGGTMDAGFRAPDPKTGAVQGLSFMGVPVKIDPMFPSRAISFLDKSTYYRVKLGEPGPVYGHAHTDAWHPDTANRKDNRELVHREWSALGCTMPQNSMSIQNIEFVGA